jgi:hypothetical protein
MKKTLKKFVSNKDGKVAIVQSPNLPIIGWFMSLVVAQFLNTGYLKTGLLSLSSAFIFLWAYLEIVQGASYFRRLLGLIVMTIVITLFFV